jgi:hypothetical protein
MTDSVEKYHVLSEISDQGFRQLIPYGPNMPNLRAIVRDLVQFLSKLK